MTPRGVDHLRHLGLGDFIGKDATDTDTMLVNVKHDPCGFLARLVEEALQDVDHEFHRRIVVVQDENAIERRLLRLGLYLGYDRRACSTPRRLTNSAGSSD